MSDSDTKTSAAKIVQKLIRQQARAIKEKRTKDQKEKLQKQLDFSAEGGGDPKNIVEAIEAISNFLKTEDKLYRLVARLDALLPKEDGGLADEISLDEMESLFLTGRKFGDTFPTMIGMVPPTIALIALNSFMKNGDRFQIIDPNSLPYAMDCSTPYDPGKVTHTTVEIAGEQVSVPVNGEYWVKDQKLEVNFIISYGPTPSGGISLTVNANYDHEEKATQLVSEIKDEILKSPMIRGRVLEITSGDEFKVLDFGFQPEPIMSPALREEIQKNVINLFEKREYFEKYGLGLKRSLILCGPPGCGKTMIERWTASQLAGKVTTLWVTAKAIRNAEDVKSVFDMARKLSPALVVMEDLDLISGTRDAYSGDRGAKALGEMLNQLDGISKDDAIVMVGSTNKVSSLDEALAERPGRFDRIFQVGCPEPHLAKEIAIKYLESRNVDSATISDIDFASLTTGNFTGAQVVEIVKGAIFEAVHLNCRLSTACLKRSVRGLEEQKKLLKKE